MNDSFKTESGGEGFQTYGQSNKTPPYQNYGSSYNQPSVRTKGKPFAILAFVFAMVALSFFVSMYALNGLVLFLQESLVFVYDDLIFDFFIFEVVMMILYALGSNVMAVFAYVGHAKNVRNNNRSKLVLAFAIIATVISNLLIVDIIVIILLGFWLFIFIMGGTLIVVI